MKTERKPPVTRKGRTHKVCVNKATLYITVNRDEKGRIIECFGKADEGLQGHVDAACLLISLGIQGRATVGNVARHLAHNQTPPNGFAGQPRSIYDAISKVLTKEQEAL